MGQKTLKVQINIMAGFQKEFLLKYPKYEKVLRYYALANKVRPSWDNLTKPRLARFVDYMRTTLAPGTVRTYCAMFKSVMRLYNEEIDMPRGYELILSPPRGACQNIWLTDEEIQRLLDYKPETKAERLVRNRFCIGALTGARHSDYENFTKENIVNGKMNYVAEKTKARVEIPLSPAVERLLNEKGAMSMPERNISLVSFNSNIREICRKAGITDRVKIYQRGKFMQGEKWQFVSSHTARRSFATNLHLKGVNIYTICMLMGHTNTAMTERYIVCGLHDLPAKVNDYLMSFK